MSKSKRDTIRLNVELDPELHRKLKIECAKRGETVAKPVTGLIKLFVSKDFAEVEDKFFKYFR